LDFIACSKSDIAYLLKQVKVLFRDNDRLKEIIKFDQSR